MLNIISAWLEQHKEQKKERREIQFEKFQENFCFNSIPLFVTLLVGETQGTFLMGEDGVAKRSEGGYLAV